MGMAFVGEGVMLTERTTVIDTGRAEVGDIISFNLAPAMMPLGACIKAMAVRETPEGMLYVMVDCIGKHPMFNNPDKAEVLDYEHSDLRKWLNEEVIKMFPREIRDRMVGMRVGENAVDLLRIPTEKEIFGKNRYGESEDISVKRFYGMENGRNRIAFHDGVPYWYWLQNRNAFDTAAFFAYVGSSGLAAYYFASYSRGVRPAFCLS